MQLVTFSVQDYRSITTANRVEVGQTTVLVGPNNEGKSNVLRALVAAMEILKTGGRQMNVQGIKVLLPLTIRGGFYNWEEDFPIRLQDSKPNGVSIFKLEFQLDEQEVSDFWQEVNSSLNGNLPIQLEVGRSNVTFTVPKKGPGGSRLSAKASLIARFIANRIEFEYIRAIRTAESAERVVNSLVEKELETLEGLPEYQQALSKIKELQQPVLDNLSSNVHKTMIGFLPAIKSVQFEILEKQRFLALRRSARIIVDDGTPTELERKGDGVQSLAALALMRHASESRSKNKSFVIAIEEPESHLHPNAMHLLRKVIWELSAKYQVVITTHSPLFVDRQQIRSNILVHQNKAVPAKSVDQIREILGVRASDNLRHAELVLVVEGEDDKLALSSILSSKSVQVTNALASGKLAFETLAGGTNLAYVLGLLRDALLCTYHCFLDNDECGRDSYTKAESNGLLTLADVNLAAVPGMQDSEFEDFYDIELYREFIRNRYSVQPEINAKFKNNKKKWSDRMADVFKTSGKPWDSTTESQLKLEVAKLAAANPEAAIHSTRMEVITNLINSLETKLTHLQSH